MTDVRLQIGRAATHRIRLGDEAGNFARHVRQRGELAEMLPPRIKFLVADRRFRAMVENEENFRATGDELRHHWQLRMDDAEVESEIEFCQRVNAGDEIWLQTKIRLGLRPANFGERL